jgi:type IV secretion system protein VirD4
MGANVELVATWLVGEAAGANGMVGGGGEFFRDMGKSLIMAILADILSDEDPRAERTLRRLRKVLVTPEEEMRQVLRRIHANSASAFARDKAGTLMGLVAETFSGVYANAAQATQWLSNAAYADLVSGDSFRSSDLRGGRLTIYIQIPLKTLQATPGVARVVLGALLNAICEADGDVEGRALFLLDEVARLGPMGALEAARDTIRKSKATLVLLYQSVGQIEKQWGAEGKTAWYASASWRIYAGVSDQTTLKELSEACGAHGVVASSQGDTAGVSGRGVGSNQTSSGRSENYSEMGRALIKGDELLQDTRADEAFVIVRGSRPLRCGRAIFFRRREMIAQVEAAVRPS